MKTRLTLEQQEALGKVAHEAAPKHCRWQDLYPVVREAYRVQGVKVAVAAAEMCADIAAGYDGQEVDSRSVAARIAEAIRERFAEVDEPDAIGCCENCEVVQVDP